MSTVSVAKFDDLVDGSGVAVDVGEDRIAVFRVGDEVHAIADRCSHAEASLAEGESVRHRGGMPQARGRV